MLSTVSSDGNIPELAEVIPSSDETKVKKEYKHKDNKNKEIKREYLFLLLKNLMQKLKRSKNKKIFNNNKGKNGVMGFHKEFDFKRVNEDYLSSSSSNILTSITSNNNSYDGIYLSSSDSNNLTDCGVSG